VLPAERRRYLSGEVDEEFEALLSAIRDAHRPWLPDAEARVVVERPGEVDLGGDATWRALERLYSSTTRRWVRLSVGQDSPYLARMSRHVSFYAGGHTPRVFAGGGEVGPFMPAGPADFPRLAGYEGPEGRLVLARITARRYLDEASVSRLGKRPPVLVQLSETARLYQTMNLTVDEIRWRLEQLVSLRLEVLKEAHRLTGERRRFSFYEIARAARLLDGHFPDAGVAAEALARSVNRALQTGVPLVDVAYLSVTTGESF
jgi:hypothetical protein